MDEVTDHKQIKNHDEYVDILNSTIENQYLLLTEGVTEIVENTITKSTHSLQSLQTACEHESCSKDWNVYSDEKELFMEKGEEGSIEKSIDSIIYSDIDWHEVTKFAQGELFDPDSATAKEMERIVSKSKDGLALAFKVFRRVDFDLVVEEAEKCVTCVINTGWQAVSHCELPQWLRDNDFLWHMHRPQLPSFRECFCSMFRLHTETGNIWTHFCGMFSLVFAMLIIYFRPKIESKHFPHGYEEYIVFGTYFVGCIFCLTFSWLYHTCCCHSEKASSLFSKLDYTGIACMIMGGFIPCIYFGFYCSLVKKLTYIIASTMLGFTCILISLWDKFASPRFRPLRAGMFIALGLSVVIPCIHMIFVNGFMRSVRQAALGWMVLMAVCTIGGAVIYAVRIPERFFPGKCNLVFQSHQIFHVLVVVAAFIHLHGCCEMASYRIELGRNCHVLLDNSSNFTNYINSTISSHLNSTFNL